MNQQAFSTVIAHLIRPKRVQELVLSPLVFTLTSVRALKNSISAR
jgi:hypothetical protein